MQENTRGNHSMVKDNGTGKKNADGQNQEKIVKCRQLDDPCDDCTYWTGKLSKKTS
jgi:hypothetical protein